MYPSLTMKLADCGMRRERKGLNPTQSINNSITNQLRYSVAHARPDADNYSRDQLSQLIHDKE